MQKIETGISELLKRQPVTEQEKDAYIQDLQKAMRLLLEEVRDLEEVVALLQKKRFGSSSEATPVQEKNLWAYSRKLSWNTRKTPRNRLKGTRGASTR